ncbi:(2Fe-2S)-binding protein [Candidatus Pacearchaeota archaeon]|nr:(2Fe-2S)-binding protein [Candidatus Pacearchaeota archaeon]
MVEKKKKSGDISRREFLKDAGLLIGGTAIGSTVLLAGCSEETATETVTQTQTQTDTKTVTQIQEQTTTVTSTQQVGTVTETQTESRFICPIDGVEFNSLAGLQVHFEAEHGEVPSTAALNVVRFTVNGHRRELQVKPYDVLNEVLRDQFGLTSIKDMCTGQGACGSCSVIVDSRPILSCMALAIHYDGSVMETSEGISDANHPLIGSYIKNYCMQCGYCTPGFVVTAKALLDRNPNPTEEEIRDALGGNLCRCGTYLQHIIAVREAAAIIEEGK